MFSFAKRLIYVYLFFFAFAAFAEDVKVYNIEFTESGVFEPSRLEVEAGRFKLVITNKSSKAIEFESTSLRKERVIAGGKKATINFNIVRPGEYEYFNDFDSTNKGVIVIKAST